MAKLASDFLDSCPLLGDVLAPPGGENEKPTLYLPTRALGEFVLVRLHGSGLLLEKLATYCALAGDKQLKRLRLGHFWGVALNNMGAISRIW